MTLMKSSRSILAVVVTVAFPWLLGLIPGHAQELRVDFERPTYQTAVGVPISIRTHLDSPVASGLFSYGVRLVFDAQAGGLITESGIIAPAPLNFNGVQGSGAFKVIDEGFAGVKGTVDVFADPQVYFTETEFVVFDMRFSKEGEYVLDLDTFRTLGPTESIFVTGDGAVLDDMISFGTATVTVVPEPGTVVLLILGACALRLGRRRRAPGLGAPAR